MANVIRIKRRTSGAAGAPSSLHNAELAFNEVGNVLYYGKGTGGVGGTATEVIPIGGDGAFQARDSDLDALAGLSSTGLMARTGSGTATTRTLTAPAAGITVTNGDGVSGNPTLVLANDLAALEGLTSNGLIARTADGAAATRALTAPAAGITVTHGDGVSGNPTLALANDLAALEGLSTTGLIARTADGVATTRTLTGTSGRVTVTDGNGVSNNPTVDLATSGVTSGTYTKITVDSYGRATTGAQASLSDLSAPTAAFGFGSQRLTSLADPTQPQDAATKNYVDLVVQGLDPKQSVKAATTTNLAALSGPMTIDGVALVAGDRVLVKNQTTVNQNGIYVVAAGAWTRASDVDTWAELISAYVFVEQGTINADMGYLCTIDAGGTLGTTDVTWVQFNGAGQILAGAGLSKDGNTLNVEAGTGITVAADNVALTGQALALHNLASNGIFVRTAAGTVAARSIAENSNGISISNGDGVAGNPTITLSDALASVGGLTPASDRLAYYTGANTASLATLTTFGRSLLDDTDAATARTTLELGSIATQAASSVAITGGSVTNLTTFDGVTVDGGTF